MPILKGYQQLVEEAESVIKTYSVEDVVQQWQTSPTMQLIDLRDLRELEREGCIAGAFHAPRGMLEFWVDPASPYHKPIFAQDKEFVLFCGAGWRSALAAKTLQEMGMTTVAHLAGGFMAWREQAQPIVTYEQFRSKNKGFIS